MLCLSGGSVPTYYILLNVLNIRFTASDDDSNKKDDEDLKLALHNYTRSVLDSTYYQECTLTGLEFQGDAPFRQIAAVNKALSLPPQLCGSPDKVGEVLGTELVECVYWRVGALLYMFCHSLYEGDSERRAKMDKDMFLEVCVHVCVCTTGNRCVIMESHVLQYIYMYILRVSNLDTLCKIQRIKI